MQEKRPEHKRHHGIEVDCRSPTWFQADNNYGHYMNKLMSQLSDPHATRQLVFNQGLLGGTRPRPPRRNRVAGLLWTSEPHAWPLSCDAETPLSCFLDKGTRGQKAEMEAIPC